MDSSINPVISCKEIQQRETLTQMFQRIESVFREKENGLFEY